MTIIRPPQHDEPAVLSPELQRLVDYARDQPTPPLRVGADAVFAGYTAAKRGQRRVALVAVGGLLAAGLAAFALVRLDQAGPVVTGPSGQVAQHMAPGPAEPRPVAPPPAVLDPAVRIVAEGETPSPTVLGPWLVGLAPGSYAVEVDDHPGDETLRARSAGGTVEVHHGRVQILVGAAHTEARLEHGVATWVAPLGERTPLTVPDEPVQKDIPAAPDASELARRAEAQLTAGKRDAAVKLLTQLVNQHPGHPAARSALMDLAGLLKGEGRTDEARCAYRLYLGRYPGKAQLADEVEKALARLGDGPACRGLRPR
jgi:hypothetical protein